MLLLLLVLARADTQRAPSPHARRPTLCLRQVAWGTSSWLQRELACVMFRACTCVVGGGGRSQPCRLLALPPTQQIGNLKPLFKTLYPECWKTHVTCSQNLSNSLTYTQGAQPEERATSHLACNVLAVHPRARHKPANHPTSSLSPQCRVSSLASS